MSNIVDLMMAISKTVRFRRRPTAGNSNIVAKTGSTYVSESMTDIIKIPTAYLSFRHCELEETISIGDSNNLELQ